MRIHSADADALRAAGVVELGRAFTHAKDEGFVARQLSVRFGATHYALVDEWLKPEVERGELPATSNTQGYYAVLRVPEERWGDLPAHLRPKPRAESLPPNCEHTHRDRAGRYHGHKVFVVCSP